MTAISLSDPPRRADRTALTVTALAILSSVVAPMLYVIAAPAACGAAAITAPRGRRSMTALAVWVPVSAAVMIGVTPIG